MAAPDKKNPTDALRGDDALILALAAGAKAPDAADAAGVSERTVYRRLESSDFRQRVQAVRDGLFAEACGCLAAASADAVRTLRRLLKAKSEATRLGASRAILENVVRLREAVDVQSRLAELERRTGATDERDNAA
jgi:hypothetical protein